MFNLAKLFVTIGADDAPLNGKLASIKPKLQALAATRFNLPGGGLAAALGLGAGVAAVGKMITSASDLGETMSKVDVTFGRSAGVVTSFAQEMADSFGLPKKEMLDAAAAFGLILTGSGFAEDKAAAMSRTMAKLAADCSSFYNVPVADALEKIRAGMTGESEPLKAFGVMMDEDSVKAKALSMGLAKAGKDLDNNAKIQARLAIIQEKTSKANGDLERTAGSASNQMKKFWGALENIGATVGGALLPAFTSLVQLLNEMATDLQNYATSSQESWGGFFSSFTGWVDTAGAVYRNLGAIFERTGVLIAESLTHAWEYLRYGAEVAGAVGEAIGGTLGEAFVGTLKMAQNLKDNLVDIFTEIWNYVRSGFRDPIEFHLKPIMEDVDVRAHRVKMPELKLSDFSGQYAAIDGRMVDAEAARGKAKFDAQQKAAAAAKAVAAVPGQDGKKADGKNLVTDLDAWQKEVSEAALGSKGKDPAAAAKEAGERIVAAIQKQTQELVPNLKKPNQARVAAG